MKYKLTYDFETDIDQEVAERWAEELAAEGREHIFPHEKFVLVSVIKQEEEGGDNVQDDT